MKKERWHIISEKDVGLFSLIQQAISHIPLALSQGRVPVALYGSKCCYWTEKGHMGRNNVWEYYFQPIMDGYTCDSIPGHIKGHVEENPPDHESSGYYIDDNTFVSCHFGDHRKFKGKSLKIPYLWNDPDLQLRKKSAEIIRQYVRPRSYLLEKSEKFFLANMEGRHTIGVHIRATDVNDLKTEYNVHRRYSYQPQAYRKAIEDELRTHQDARVFIATDSQEALDLMKKSFPDKIIHYSSMYHTEGAASGKGPTGWGMPGYLTEDGQKAAQNGEEAIIDYLLLGQCDYLIHNGSSLPRTVLLKNPELNHSNIHSRNKYLAQLFSPGSLELLYFLKIITKKAWWKWSGFLKKKIKHQNGAI